MNKEQKLQIEQEMKVNKQNAIFAPTVRVDGVYQSKKISDYYSYLRFYADGLVIVASVSGSPKDIAIWFNREWSEKKYASKGTYVISGSNIKFSATSSYGTVDYEGDIQGEHLVIRAYSHINNYRGVSEYKFIQLDAWATAET